MLFIYLPVLFQVYWCLPLCTLLHQTSLRFFLCTTTTLTVRPHPKQLLRSRVMLHHTHLKIGSSFGNTHGHTHNNPTSLNDAKDRFNSLRPCPGDRVTSPVISYISSNRILETFLHNRHKMATVLTIAMGGEGDA